MKKMDLFVFAAIASLIPLAAIAGSGTITSGDYECTATSRDTWGADETWGYLTEKGKPLADQTVKVYRARSPHDPKGTTYVSFKHKDWVYLGEDVTDSKGYYEATMNEDYDDIVKNTGGEFYIDTPYFGDEVTL